MPILVASGNRIGAMIKRIDDGSITLPAASSRMLTTSRNIQRLKFLSLIQAAISCGSPVDPRLPLAVAGIASAFIELRRFHEAIVAGKKAQRKTASSVEGYRGPPAE